MSHFDIFAKDTDLKATSNNIWFSKVHFKKCNIYTANITLRS